MVFKIAGGIAFILMALQDFGIGNIPVWATGVALFIAGIALIAGGWYGPGPRPLL